MEKWILGEEPKGINSLGRTQRLGHVKVEWKLEFEFNSLYAKTYFVVREKMHVG